MNTEIGMCHAWYHYTRVNVVLMARWPLQAVRVFGSHVAVAQFEAGVRATEPAVPVRVA